MTWDNTWWQSSHGWQSYTPWSSTGHDGGSRRQRSRPPKFIRDAQKALAAETAASGMQVDESGGIRVESSEEAVPLLPSPPREPPTESAARDAHHEQLMAGVEWIVDEMAHLNEGARNGGMQKMGLEELMETRDDWRQVRNRLQAAVTAMDQALTEMTTVMAVKHQRVGRQLASIDESDVELAQPVKIEPLVCEQPPGKRRVTETAASSSSSRVTAASSSSTRVAKAMPAVRGSLAKQETGVNAQDRGAGVDA